MSAKSSSTSGRGRGGREGGRGGRGHSGRGDTRRYDRSSDTRTSADRIAGGSERKEPFIERPNSIAQKAGKPGYDEDGIKLISPRADGSYQMTEVWRTFELWCGENNCGLIMGMFKGPKAQYERYDPIECENTIDMLRYELVGETFYRDKCKRDLAQCNTLHPKVIEQETRAYTKLWSIIDERLVSVMRRDSDFIYVTTELKRPYALRLVIMEAVNSGLLLDDGLAKAQLRKEWTSWKMETAGMTINNYKVSWDDFIERSTFAELEYTDSEMATTFIMGLSSRWLDKKTALLSLTGEQRKSNVAEVYDELIQWEATKLSLCGSITSSTAISGRPFANYPLIADEEETPKTKKTWGKKQGGKGGGKKQAAGAAVPADTDDSKKLKDADIQCYRCKGYGHKSFECSSKTVGALICFSERSARGHNVLLDEGAQVSVFFNRKIVAEVAIATKSERISGFMIDGTPLAVEESGLFLEVPVFVSDHTSINILAREDARKSFDLYNLEGWGTRAIGKSGQGVYDFLLESGDGAPVLDLKNPIAMGDEQFRRAYTEQEQGKMAELLCVNTVSSRRACVLTVAERAKLFTVKERDRATLARSYAINSGYRGLGKLIKSLAKMTGVTITAQDIKNSSFIYGSRAALKGRSRDGPAPLVLPDIKPSLVRSLATLQCDIMDMLGKQFAVAMVRPSALGLVVPLRGNSMLKALETIVHTCQSLRLKVTDIVVDPERALVKAARQLEGVTITEVGPGDHVVDAENFIMVLKNIARCVIHGLPWNLPPSLVKPLILFAVRRRNGLICDATGEIPLETSFGEKVDWGKEFQFGFGDLVECYVKPKKTNQMVERTVSGIALYPVGRVGAWRVRYLDTWTDGTSRRCTLIPTDTEHIHAMNMRAQEENPSDAYRNALSMEKAAEVEGDEGGIAAPDLVEAIPLPLIEEEEPLAVAIEAAEEVDVIADAVAALDEIANVGDVDAPMANSLRVVGTGKGLCYKIAMLTKQGAPIKQFIATMRKGSSKSSIRKALKQTGSKGERVMAAAIEELKQIDDKGSWTPVLKSTLSRQELKGIVRTFMFVIDKFTPDGEIIKVKARLVAMGNMQNPDGISMDTSAPTVDITSVLTMAAIAAAEKRYTMTCDVGGAFLHTVWPKDEGRQIVHLDKVNASILTQIRPDYADMLTADGSLYLDLERALYGLVQSARLWYNRLTDVLKREGYVANPSDPCVFNKGGGLAAQTTVMFHVDDLSCSSRNLEVLKRLEELLTSEFGEEHIKCVWGDDHDYLGMRFLYNSNGTVNVSMQGYIQAILDYAGFTGKETARTPASANLFELCEKAPKLIGDKSKLFHSLVQGLSYASQRVRWDILLVISFLKGRVSCPDEYDWLKLWRCLAYLNATKDLSLTLGLSGEGVTIDSSIDASHAVYADARSQGGLSISLGLGVVKARSHKLGLNTKSSMESELVSTSDDVSEVIHLKEFLEGQGYDVGSAKVRQDNQATIRSLEKGRSDSKRTKHINTRFYFVHDRLDKGELHLEYTPTEEMVADFFTKPLQGTLFLKMRDKLLGVSGFAPSLRSV
jgi:hypothetical protein